MEIIAASHVFEEIFPSFLDYLGNEDMMVKISMLITINSNFCEDEERE